MTKTQRAYLAGLLDGEAYVAVIRKANKQYKRGISYGITVVTSMTSLAPLKYAQQISGVGSIVELKKRPNRKKMWSWSVYSREASKLLQEVVQYMLVKKKSALACIEFQDAMRLRGRTGITDSEFSEQKKLWKKTKVNP